MVFVEKETIGMDEMNNDLMFSSNKDDWETPQNFYDELNKEFHFTLDAAADNDNSKCDYYLNDALNDKWHGMVFCNPPYGKMTPLFIEKGAKEFYKMNCELIVFLDERKIL